MSFWNRFSKKYFYTISFDCASFGNHAISQFLIIHIGTYRVRQLILIHFRGTFFHDKMTLYSKINDFRDPEIGRFDMKHYFFTSLTSHGLHDLRKKRYKIFEEMWAWGLHGYATPFSLRLKVAEYQGFHMWYTSLLY